jgi:DNA-binding LacI/PurR family transcriptional regulator
LKSTGRPIRRGAAQDPVRADLPPADDPVTRERHRVQMADIARMAGVSVATVSRALSGSPLIASQTRVRIAELARSVNYTINVGAKNLRLGQSRTIAVVIPYDRQSRQHISDPFFLAMLGSLADALTERGFDMLVSRVDADRLDEAALPYDTGVVLGVILIGQWRHHDQLNRLAGRRVPIVVWGAQMPQQLYCSVGGDNLAGGALATRHLLDHGRRRIVFVGDPHLPEVEQRYRGYLRELENHGIAPDERLCLEVPFEASLARAAICRLCDAAIDFDAVFACSDVLAMAAIQGLRANHRAVPRSVAVVGYDDIAWASHADPPLTTIRQPITLAGVEIVDALLAIVAGEEVPPRTLPVELVVRESSLG